jgi:hypothetical protein
MGLPVNASLRPTNACPFGWNYQGIALGLLCPLEYDAASLADMLLEIGQGSQNFVTSNICEEMRRHAKES